MISYPLTSPQREIWFDQQLHADVPLYNIGGYMEVRGTIEPARLAQAVALLMQRHDALRTTLLASADEDGLPLQTFGEPREAELPIRDFSDQSHPHQAALAWMQKRFQEPFCLSGQTLFGYELLKLADDLFYMLLRCHHVIIDGWGVALINRSLAEIYTQLADGQVPALDAPSYANFVEDDRRYVGSDNFEKSRQYWLAQYPSAPQPLFMPRHRHGDQSASGNEVLALPQAFFQRLGQMAKRHQATTFHVLLAALYVYFTRSAQRDDLAIGLPVLNRANAQFRNTLGLFVGVTAARFAFGQELSFAQLLAQINRTLRNNYRHQRLPISEINRALGLNQGGSRLFDLCLSYENLDFELSFAGADGFPHTLLHGHERTPLMIFVREYRQSQDVICEFAYNRAYFNAAEIRVLQSRLVTLLEAVLEHEELPIRLLPLMAATEIAQLQSWNATQAEFPRQVGVAQLFAAQVARTPEGEALVHGQQRLSYAELNRRANRLAHRLIALGVAAESRVGICLERSPTMVVALLAVLKAGAAYVPIAAEQPAARRRFIVEDCAATVLLTEGALIGEEELDGVGCALIRLDAHDAGPWPEHDPEPRSTGENLAYVIYTSGSTGQPKGVMIEQAGLVNTIVAYNRAYALTPQDRTLQVASFAFDVSVAEILPALCAGAALVIADRADLLDPARFQALLGREGISLFGATPLLLAQLAFKAEDLPRLRQIFSGGEALSAAHLAGLPRSIALVNGYGPTEATIGATAYRIAHTAAEAERMPIGKPLANYRVYILDAAQKPLPIGVAGELSIAGVALARGYLNRPELTAEKFIEADVLGRRERLYRSGDKARWLADGNLEFLGRLDQQVKLRGFRIELGEIEAALAALPGVAEAVVIARGEGVEQRLVAYAAGRDLEAAALRAALQSRLPDYMVPAAIVVLDHLPLGANGKIDHARLPPPTRLARAENTEPLSSETERRLATLWSALLCCAVETRAANFFELGGHSLQATRLASRIRDSFGVDMPLKTLFEHPQLGAMAAWLAQAPRDATLPPIVPLAEAAPRVLSYAQQRLWFLAQLEDAAPTYNMPAAVQLRGVLDLPALRRTFLALEERHHSLRQYFPTRAGEPTVALLPQRDRLVVSDLSSLSDSEREQELRRRSEAHASQAFDLQHGPLLRLELLILDAETQVLLLNMHHIICDGWSVEVLLREWRELYGAFRQGLSPSLPPPTLQYTDYAAWQRRLLQGERLQRQVDYWVDKLAGAAQVLELPTDHPRPAQRSHRGANLRMQLSPELSQQLKQLGQAQGATLFMTLFAAFNVLLARYSGQDDLLIGTPIANRAHSRTENLVGFFVNTLVLRTRVDATQRFSELLAQVRATALDAYAHQDLPFETLVEALNPPRSLSHTPLFQVMFALQNAVATELTLPGLEVALLPAAQSVAKFDLALGVGETELGLSCDWEYSSALFAAPSIARMAAHYTVLLQQIVARPDAALGEYSLLSAAEIAQLQSWNATQAEFPHQVGVAQLFAAQVARTPEGEALVHGQQRLSYAELNRRANRLAHRLIARGVMAESRVGICLERSPAMVVALLAVLKAGAAYVPIAAEQPAARRRFIVEDCAATVLLTEGALIGEAELEGVGCTLLRLDADDAHDAEPWPEDDPEPRSTGENLAYVIYTSGSTGQPKGVMIEQASLVNSILTYNRSYALTPQDRTLQSASFAFDVSVVEILPALCAGAALVIADHADLLDPARFQALLGREGISLFGAPPLLLAQLAFKAEDLPRLRQIFSGGEALSAAHLAGLPRSIALVNGYGPTEATIGATAYRIAHTAAEAERMPIGKPLANYRVYILDAMQQPLPIGVAGELSIAGVALARGYLNRPELTAEKFIEADVLGRRERLYRSGDRARWLADGNLEFLGRMDQQVKLRGFRIELGEIEAALAAVPGVAEAVVIARGEGVDKQLVGYAAGHDLEAAALRAALKSRLPDYMVPAAIVVLDHLPLGATGKIDRERLPEPPRLAPSEATATPQDALEEILLGLWAVVLEQSSPGLQDNFFELGGHSFRAIQLAARLRDALGLELPVRWIFEYPTVAELAARIRRAQAGEMSEASEGANEAENDSVAPNRIEPGSCRITPEDLPLIKLTQDDIDLIVRSVDGGVANVQDIYPLSPLQEGILYHHLLQPETDPYLSQVQLAFDSLPRCEAFVAALQRVNDRHDILRTAVVWAQLSEPVQVVWRRVQLPVETRRFDAAQGAVAQQLFDYCGSRYAAFDLTRAPMRRIVIAEDGDRVLLSMIGHHLTMDHTALAVLLQEVKAVLQGEAEHLPPPVLYRNFVARMRQGLPAAAHEAFFRAMLGTMDTPSAPFGLLDVHGDGSGNSGIYRDFPLQLAQRLRHQARHLGATPASLFHLAFALLLSRCCAQRDVVFGTVLFGRLQGGAGVERSLGLFINTLPLRISCDARPLATALRETQQRMLELLRHEHASLSLAQRCSALPAPAPLFSALFNYRHSPERGDSGLQLEGAELLHTEGRTNYPFVMSIDDLGEGFGVGVETDAAIAADRIFALMQRTLEVLIEALERAPETALNALDILPSTEVAQLQSWNATQAEFPRQVGVAQLFAAQVARTPEGEALVHGQQRLSYAELNRRANRLAHRLIARGVMAESRVGICLERSPVMVVALLAVLKAGAAYVPIAAEQPAARRRFIVEDCAATVLLTEGALIGEEGVEGLACALIRLDADDADDGDDGGPWPEHDPEPRSTGENLAYVIYTSGSTGQPKGVMIEQAGLVNTIVAYNRAYALTPQDRTLQSASFAFDVSVVEILPALCAGAALVIADHEDLLDPARFVALLGREGISLFGATPLLLAQLAFKAEDLPRLRQIFSGGEALSAAHLAGLPRSIALVNGYGPTEATIGATAYRIAHTAAEAERMPIGKPLANYRVYILDAAQKPLPIGVAGELSIAGVALARGYLNRPELTAEKFIEADVLGRRERLYRSGDRARWLADGNLEFLGRMDQQVKLRGFRIELGEIEAVLAALPGVAEAAVIARGEGVDKQLVGYVAGHDLEAAALRAALKSRLPDYMVPAAIVVLEHLPLGATGKIDRQRLPQPDVGRSADEFVAPRNAAELLLAQIWEDVLGISPLSVTADFFSLGGHSLLAMRLMRRIQQRFGCSLPLASLFQYPTIAGLVGRLDNAPASRDFHHLVPIQPRGERRPLYLLPGAGGHVLYFYALAMRLGQAQPLFGLETPGLYDAAEIQDSVERHAAHLLRTLRQQHCAGPYRLAGHSAGAVVAFELARQLEAQGEEVQQLIVLDAAAPSVSPQPALSKEEALRDIIQILESLADVDLGLDDALLRAQADDDGRYALVMQRLQQRAADLAVDNLRQIVAVYEAMSRNQAVYRPPHGVHCPITVVLAQQASAVPDAAPAPWDWGWQAYTTASVQLIHTPGTHLSMLREPYVQSLAIALTDATSA